MSREARPSFGNSASGGQSGSLDTDSAAVAQLVSQKQVEQLPLNGRNFLNLLFIGAGAVQPPAKRGADEGRGRKRYPASMAAVPPRTIHTPWTTGEHRHCLEYPGGHSVAGRYPGIQGAE